MSSGLRGPRAVADVSVGMIIATVEVAVTPERVFSALSTDEIAFWWGDDATYHTTAWKADVRVGGAWRADGVGADGRPFSVHGEYLEVDPPRRLVQTWKPDWDPGSRTTLTYLLERIEGGTRVTVRHEGFGAEQRDSCRNHASGWERVLGWLVRHYTGASPPAQRRFYVFRLVPPRPTFPFDMSVDERKVMEEHGQYWRRQLEAGRAIVFGPVNDPSGPWGLAAVEVADEQEMAAVRDGDPALTGRIGMRCEVLPMLAAVARP